MRKGSLISCVVLLFVAASFATPLPTCSGTVGLSETAPAEVYACTITGFQVAPPGVVLDFVTDIPNGNLSDTVTVANTGPNELLVTFFSDPSASLFEPLPTITALDNGVPVTVVANSTTPGGLPLILSFFSDADPAAGPVSDSASFRVPEPAGLALVGSGLLGLGVILRRRARKQV